MSTQSAKRHPPHLTRMEPAMNCANSDFLNDLRNNKAFLLEVLDQPIVFHKVYKKITGSITAALMLSYATQLSDNLEPARGGWFVVDANIWEEETGLTPKEQSAARRNLREFGLLSERKQGMPPFLEIKVNFQRIAELLHDYANSLPDCAPHAPHPVSVASGKKTAA
jgi:hypothetical protein